MRLDLTQTELNDEQCNGFEIINVNKHKNHKSEIFFQLSKQVIMTVKKNYFIIKFAIYNKLLSIRLFMMILSHTPNKR
jgi:hypothetical protein